MRIQSALVLLLAALAVSCTSVQRTKPVAAPGSDPNHWVFLLIGQSNMVGTPKPLNPDLALDPRVRVLGYENSASPMRAYNKWSTAYPPLHNAWAGVGPGDWFAKTLLESVPPGVTIDLVPCSIAGVDIDFFRKGVVSKRRSEFSIPPDNSWSGAYEWVIDRARLAQKTGVIKGILFHQGESDSGQTVWLTKVKAIVADLRADLGLGEVPFLAGELLYTGACAGHNVLVNQLPQIIPRAFVVSAQDLAGTDEFHFNLEGQREFGKRYAATMKKALGL